MELRHHCLFLLAMLITSTSGQNEGELHIPVENDNQFPPDNHSELDGNIIEGSGAGAVEEPLEATTAQSSVPLIEDVQLTSLTGDEQSVTPKGDFVCPKPCVCNIEGGSNDFVVNCIGYDLTDIPAPLDSKTTTLNVQNNKITQIPKEVSALKNLKVFNANNNSIKELSLGSVSELPELTILKLANNKLIEYPNDLKNAFGLTKLEELDLGGNDMRTTLTPEHFSNFKTLRQLTLPTSTTVFIEDLCRILKDSLENVCTGSCSEHTFECPDSPQELENSLLSAILPGTIAVSSILEESAEPAIQTEVKTSDNNLSKIEESVKETAPINNTSAIVSTDVITEASEPSLRTALDKQPVEVSQLNSVIESPVVTTTGNEPDVAVGATTASTKTGGVDKSVIGMIVAGMVLVVAGITIKKNWSSIKNKFSSQRPPNDRVGVNGANGVKPEEVPLQEKSPV